MFWFQLRYHRFFHSDFTQTYPTIMTNIIIRGIFTATITGAGIIIHELSLDRLEFVLLSIELDSKKSFYFVIVVASYKRMYVLKTLVYCINFPLMSHLKGMKASNIYGNY